MADNVTLPGAGSVVAADDVGGTLYQRVKLAVGADGSATDATLAAPVPVQLSDGSAALIGQKTQAASISITHPSDVSLRVIDCAPSGAPWTTTAGKLLTLTAAGTLLVAAGTSRLRSLVIMNPYVGATVYYFLYHLATAPTWAGSLTIAADTLLQSGQIGANNTAAVTSDLPGGWYVPNGALLVVSLVAASNANHSAPGSNLFATFRSGS